MTKQSTEVATKPAGLPFVLDVPENDAQLPAHIDRDSTEGNQNVGQEDLQTPRLKLLQYISNEVKKKNSEYVEGAEPGLMMDSVTKELFTEVYLINLFYERKFNLWRTRDAGGGLIASCDSEAEAKEELAKICEAERINLDDKEIVEKTFEIVDTPTHYCLLIDAETGAPSPIIVTMESTKQKVSKAWNTRISKKPGPRYAFIWKLNEMDEQNSRGEDYKNYALSEAGWATPELCEAAKEAYDSLMKQFNAE